MGPSEDEPTDERTRNGAARRDDFIEGHVGGRHYDDFLEGDEREQPAESSIDKLNEARVDLPSTAAETCSLNHDCSLTPKLVHAARQSGTSLAASARRLIGAG